MRISAKTMRGTTLVLIILLSIALLSCATPLPSNSFPSNSQPLTSPEFKIQSIVMDMADDYIASLGEAVYLLTRKEQLDSQGRTLAQSFLRNGVGASLDIATGPNPPVSLLDLLVLASLQTWSFEKHWMPAGIGEAGLLALERLKDAEKNLWIAAGEVLSEGQRKTVRDLIDAWIAENSERTVVALVRFNEFADERRISSTALRGEARGLLREVGRVSASVDEARLFGERLLWYAGRYPYLLGEQAELTTYRILAQPEGREMVETLAATRRLSETLTKRVETIQGDLEQQQAAFFAKMSAERRAAIGQLFEQLSKERTRMLDEITARESELLIVMTELKKTISEAGALAENLTATVNAIDRVVSHFDKDPSSQSEPLRMTDIRDAAMETGRTAERLTIMLERANQILESNSLDRTLSNVTKPADALVDRIFWRGLILIGLLIIGLALLRLVPQRTARNRENSAGGREL